MTDCNYIYFFVLSFILYSHGQILLKKSSCLRHTISDPKQDKQMMTEPYYNPVTVFAVTAMFSTSSVFRGETFTYFYGGLYLPRKHGPLHHVEEYSYPIILTKVVLLSDSLVLFVCIAYQPFQGASTFPDHLWKGHLMRIFFKDANSSHRSISVAFLISKVLQQQLPKLPLLSLYLIVIQLCWAMFS